MDNDILIFWFVVITAATGVVASIKNLRAAGPGWLIISASILLVGVLGKLLQQTALLYVALLMWCVLIILPNVIAKRYRRRLMECNYTAAYRLARVISWLHPMGGWRRQPELVRALDLASRGEIDEANRIFYQFRDLKSIIGLGAMANFYRLSSQWEEFREWERGQTEMLEQYPQFLPLLLRACGETGDLPGLVELYARHQDQIAKLPAPDLRDSCRLMLFVFCGQRQLTEESLSGELSRMPAPLREFWLASADMAAGATDSARQQLEKLLPVADATTRLAIERRLARGMAPLETLPAAAEQLLQTVATERTHEEMFGTLRSPSLQKVRVTFVLIALNVIVFGIEIFLGGATDTNVLYRMGALYGPAVREGEWARLVESLFLHYGTMHLVMNMLGLSWLGPFVERAVGWFSFLVIYFLSGIGSMALVMTLASRTNADQLTVGASGCVMGLVGATGALMLRGWLRHRAAAAKNRLVAIVIIIVTQSLFDLMIPFISMTAHLSGVIIGFVVTLALRDRLQPVPPPIPTDRKK